MDYDEQARRKLAGPEMMRKHTNSHEALAERIERDVLISKGIDPDAPKRFRINPGPYDGELYLLLFKAPFWLLLFPFIGLYQIYKLNRAGQKLGGFTVTATRLFTAALLAIGPTAPAFLLMRDAERFDPMMAALLAVVGVSGALLGWKFTLYALPGVILCLALFATLVAIISGGLKLG